MYGQPVRVSHQGNGGPSSRFSFIESEAMASARRMFRQACANIAAMLGKAPGMGSGGETLTSMGDDGDGGGKPDQGPLAGAFYGPHDSR